MRDWFSPKSEVISTSGDLETRTRISLTVDQAMPYVRFATAIRVLSEGVSQLPFHILQIGEQDKGIARSRRTSTFIGFSAVRTIGRLAVLRNANLSVDV